MAAVEALFASVNPSVLQYDELNSALINAIKLVASMENHSANVRRAVYGSLAKTFGRILDEKGEGIDLDLDNLKSVLFGRDIETEALRLLRADAILAVSKASSKLASKMRSEVLVLKGEEVSSIVRDRLAAAASG